MDDPDHIMLSMHLRIASPLSIVTDYHHCAVNLPVICMLKKGKLLRYHILKRGKAFK